MILRLLVLSVDSPTTSVAGCRVVVEAPAFCQQLQLLQRIKISVLKTSARNLELKLSPQPYFQGQPGFPWDLVRNLSVSVSDPRSDSSLNIA
jgi:hypothetical protein